MGRLNGKTALITGSARGLGAAIAEHYVEQGAQVIINDLSLAQAQATASRLGGHALACDVSDSTAVAQMFNQCAELVEQLDILVCNAGISGLEGDNDARERIRITAENTLKQARGEIVDDVDDTLVATASVTDEAWNRMLGVHMNGTFFCVREALKLMLPRQTDGAIITMGSIMGTFGRGGGTAYCAAKAGILGFTRSLAHEVAAQNLRVNAIAPGWIHTDMTDPLQPMHPILSAQTPQGHLGDPSDIAHAAVYLASEEAKFMTGQVLSPNGGWYMSQ